MNYGFPSASTLEQQLRQSGQGTKVALPEANKFLRQCCKHNPINRLHISKFGDCSRVWLRDKQCSCDSKDRIQESP